MLSATGVLAKKDKSYSTTDIPCHGPHKERNGNEEATCKSHWVESRSQATHCDNKGDTTWSVEAAQFHHMEDYTLPIPAPRRTGSNASN